MKQFHQTVKFFHGDQSEQTALLAAGFEGSESAQLPGLESERQKSRWARMKQFHQTVKFFHGDQSEQTALLAAGFDL